MQPVIQATMSAPFCGCCHSQGLWRRCAGTMRSAFSNDETLIRLIEEHDTQLRYDAAFAVLQGVTWAP